MTIVETDKPPTEVCRSRLLFLQGQASDRKERGKTSQHLMLVTHIALFKLYTQSFTSINMVLVATGRPAQCLTGGKVLSHSSLIAPVGLFPRLALSTGTFCGAIVSGAPGKITF